MTSIHNLKRSRVLRALDRLGWHIDRDEGRHTILKHDWRPGLLSIPRHRVIASGTMRELLKDAGLSWQVFVDEY